MNLKNLNRSKDNGSVLLVTIVIAAVLGVTLASYLTLVSTQSRSVARSQRWNEALVIAEAGVEEALQMLNKYNGSDMLTNWVNTYSSDSWGNSANVYSLTRYLDDDKTTWYTVYITNLNAQNSDTMIHSTGYIILPSGIASSTTLDRSVLVRARIDTLFNVAMAALGTIDLNGKGIRTDSYDSLDPLYSTNGLYDTDNPSKRKANGDVATNNTITNSLISVGNASVAGHLITGPYGSYAILNGSVGDIPWVDAGIKGVKAGYWRNDMNVVFDPVTEPSVSWMPVGSPGGGTGGSGVAPDGKSYDHVFLLGDDYVVHDNGSIYVGTNVNVRIKSTVTKYEPPKIYVAGGGSNSGKLTTYLTGKSAVLDTAHVTQSGKPANLVFYGLPSVTSLSYNGNGDFSGVIYAPQAEFSLNGGGSSDVDFCGSSVTKVVQMNGHYKFHYDEDLRVNGPNKGYIATQWQEL
jgi:hypothetical protein